MLLGNWFPPSEKSRAVAMMNSGGILGMVISWGISPLMIASLGRLHASPCSSIRLAVIVLHCWGSGPFVVSSLDIFDDGNITRAR